MFSRFRDWFWKESFWLPYGFKWSDIKNAPVSDLYIAPAVTVVLLILRYLFERFIAKRFCIYIGITGSLNTKAEKLSESEWNAIIDKQQNEGSKKIRKSRRIDKPTSLHKATETCWRCVAYFLLFVYGSNVIFRTDWFWHNDKWLIGYITDQEFTMDMKYYYIGELSFYLSLLVTHFKDTKRKDFCQQFVHHVSTIILISGSYVLAHFRYGSVIMLLHDASDYWLEAAKLAKYAKKQRTCDCLFVVFAITFYLSRWIYFPGWVLYPWIVANSKLAGQLASYFTFPYIFLYLCFLLLALHLYWGYLIGRMVYSFMVTGKVEKDDRSDGDSDAND